MYANSKLASQLNSGDFRHACEVVFQLKSIAKGFNLHVEIIFPFLTFRYELKLAASADSSLVFSTAGESYLSGKVEVEPQEKRGL